MLHKKTAFITVILLLPSLWINAQEGDNLFRFLEIPASARVNAMGGNNISLPENDVLMVFQNPALLGPEMNMDLGVSYMLYLADIGVGSAMMGKSINDKSAVALGVHYFDYGTMTATNADNIVLGTFSPKDIMISGSYAHDLSEKWRGGVSAKFIYSSYEQFNSTAVCFDAGLSYFDPATETSLALTLKNVGAQLSAYNDERAQTPWDINVGLSKRLAHAPLILSVTAQYLTQWNFARINDLYGMEADNGNFFSTFFKHLVFGVEVPLSDSFWLGIGYNPKLHSDLKVIDGNTFGGWNAGAGFRYRKFSCAFAFSQYHPSATAYHFNVGIDL